MKIRLFLSTLLFAAAITVAAQGENIVKTVESGIQRSMGLTENNMWKEAFDQCRMLDEAISANGGSKASELHYYVAKERMRMYRRLNKGQYCAQQLERMYTLSQETSSAQVKEDFLLAKADYLAWTGKHQESDACYTQVVRNSIAGKNNNETGKTYEQLLQKAKLLRQPAFTRIIEKRYSAWKDSIAAVKASDDLKALQGNYAKAQEEISDQDSKIGWQRALIILLAIIVAALGGGLLFVGGFLMKSLLQIKNLKTSLNIANENNERKGAFIDKLSDHLASPLDGIAAGRVKENVSALRTFLVNIRHYMQLETSRDEQYERTDIDISNLYSSILDTLKQRTSLSVTSDVAHITFKTNKEALTEILDGILTTVASEASTESVAVSFKKTGAKTGKFIITAAGMTISDDDKDCLFKPFAKVRDITQGDGLCLPTCSLIAYKLNGALHLDEEYRKGIRFVLELRN